MHMHMTKQFSAMHIAVWSHRTLLTALPDFPALHVEAAFISVDTRLHWSRAGEVSKGARGGSQAGSSSSICGLMSPFSLLKVLSSLRTSASFSLLSCKQMQHSCDVIATRTLGSLAPKHDGTYRSSLPSSLTTFNCYCCRWSSYRHSCICLRELPCDV